MRGMFQRSLKTLTERFPRLVTPFSWMHRRRKMLTALFILFAHLLGALTSIRAILEVRKQRTNPLDDKLDISAVVVVHRRVECDPNDIRVVERVWIGCEGKRPLGETAAEQVLESGFEQGRGAGSQALDGGCVVFKSDGAEACICNAGGGHRAEMPKAINTNFHA